MTQVYVGTSGWSYSWNPDGLEWYTRFSGLNAVELNMSFYRYPYRRQVRSWARRGSGLRWAVKVNRVITHRYKLSRKAIKAWDMFKELFSPLDPYIDFYLFQLPPSFTARNENMNKVLEFAEITELGPRFAVEFRHDSWFGDKLKKISEWGVTVVSVDSPDRVCIVKTQGVVYLRMHGRSAWYAHRYSREELEEIAGRIAALNPEKVYVFFNNNHDMLDNGRTMLSLLKTMLMDSE